MLTTMTATTVETVGPQVAPALAEDQAGQGIELLVPAWAAAARVLTPDFHGALPEFVTDKVARRFYGSIQLDPARPTPQFSQVADEVISRLAGLADVSVKVRVDIEASSDGEGFSDATVRTVTENAKTLKFSNAGFEEE